MSGQNETGEGQQLSGEFQGPVATGGGEAVDQRGAQGPIYKPSGPVYQTYVTYQGAEVAVPSPQAIAQHRAALRDRLAQDARARWGGMSAYMEEEGATLPIEASPYQTGRLGPRENLLAALRSAGRLLVLGEPGSGKTVALERLAWELCADTGTATGQEPIVPVVVRLFHYEGAPLAEWVRALLQETGHLRLDGGRALDAFLHGGACRCVFLFDGLNEVAPPYRDRLVGEVVRWRASSSRHALILTSRPQDELWRRLRGEVERTVLVQPIADEQARSYLVAHLEDKGEALYARLDERLRAMARTPLILWLIKEAGAAGESLPGNRGELYARFVSRMLRRDTDRRMDAGLPERVKGQALVDLAFHLSREQRISCPREEAMEVVARALPQEKPEEVLGACAGHGLLAGEETLWYAPHQTVQEHFAALALRDMAGQERGMDRGARLLRGVRRALTRREQGLAGLAEDEWWTETFVQLAGLVEDADWLAREVARVNPWLAWWCTEEGRQVREETREAVAERSTRLLESERVADRRRAVAVLARMRSERVVGPLFRAAADEDEEVAGLAVQALVEIGGTARVTIREALQGEDRRLWKPALRYLRAQPDDSLWAEIPDRMWDEDLDVADRRRAVAVLARMRSERVVGPLFRAAADEDEEVAGLAVQALAEMGDLARVPVKEALQGGDRRQWRAALRYLCNRPDEPLWAQASEWVFGVAADEDEHVAELAAQALAGTGETVRTLVAEALRGTDRRPWRAALRCLVALPDDPLCQQVSWEKMVGQSMVWVPPGSFRMGSDKEKDPQAWDDELPQHSLTLPGYWIGRYPVTLAQFRAFVEGSGHRPGNEDSLRGEDDHPVVNVTWHDALAYCRWLARETGLPVTLPSEAEWEKAARGTDGRIYPWGDDPPDESRCNFGDLSRGTTPVGRYSPRGDSPYGCADMAGNVWEWTRSQWRDRYPYDPADGREDLAAGGARVLRGGAFYFDARSVRCAYRYRYAPDYRIRYSGLRVVVGPGFPL